VSRVRRACDEPPPGARYGAGHVERAFVERADDDVGQRRHRLARDRAGVHPGLQRASDEAEGVAQPDLPPALPAQDGGRVEQDDALDRRLGADGQERAGAGAQRAERVGGAVLQRALRDLLRRLGLDLLEDRLEQLLLAAELVVERAARDAGGAHDLLGPDARVATRGEQLARGVDELGARGGRALVLLVGGLAFHTACM